jgi:hypothetical protein
MSSFKKKKYTEPVICRHGNDLSKDWYVLFRFKADGKVHSYKRREGINRIKELNDRLSAIEELREEIAFDLKNGWNPTSDPKRELNYSPYLNRISGKNEPGTLKTKKQSKQDWYEYFLNRK